MKTLKIADYYDHILEHHKSGTVRGVDTGFKCLDELLSFKKGYATFFLGFPGAGKTEIHIECLFNLAEKFGWKHALLSCEIGTINDVIAELIAKYLRKPFFKSAGQYAATEKEIYGAMDWLNNFFYPVDGDAQDFTIDSFYEYCNQIEKDNKIKLDTTSIDPWNDLSEDLPKFGGREDKYLAHALKKVRQSAKVNGWHNMVVTHARDNIQQIILKDVNGQDVYCNAVPTLNSFAGGPVWGRRAFNVVGVWRPEPDAVNPATGIPYEPNEAMIKVLKAKPKGSATKGKCTLFYDWKRNRYYEKIDGKSFYAFEHEKGIHILKPSDLNPSTIFETETAPF